MWSPRLSVVAAAALGMSPSLVLAQGTARTQAQQIFSRGEQAFANKQYADALKAFEEAHYRVFFHGLGANQKVEIVSFRVGASVPVAARARSSTASSP